MRTPREIGELFKNTRQKKGISIEKVCKLTHLQPNIVRALEDGTVDEVIGRIYVLLSLKKYASFLYLDPDAIAKDYKESYTTQEEQKFDINETSKKPERDLEKWLFLAAFIGIIFISIFVIFFLGIKVKAFYTNRAQRKAKVTVQEVISVKKDTLFPIPKTASIKVMLKGKDPVWMEIRSDGKKVFTGTMDKGAKKEISAKKKIDLWIGRAEVLDITINNKHIGTIGKGKIRQAQITREGIKVGKKWLIQAK